MTRAGEIAAGLAEVRERIADALAGARRPAGSVRLIAVSKKMPLDDIRVALAAGQQDFGENYAQELRDKRAAFAGGPSQEAGVPGAPRWHYLGPLQRNKVKYLAGQVELIHSIDDGDVLAEIERKMEAAAPPANAMAAGAPAPDANGEPRCQAVLVQVNVAGETGKSGVPPDRLPFLLDRFVAAKRVTCRGLMLIPPLSADVGETRQFFAQLREIAQREQAIARPNVTLSELSMGMSSDYAEAVAEGATLVRVGTAIFGTRSAR